MKCPWPSSASSATKATEERDAVKQALFPSTVDPQGATNNLQQIVRGAGYSDWSCGGS
jgi:hypothetical protein